jgi:hypothetical protein
MKSKMKQVALFVFVFLGIATILFAQQQKYRREHMICPKDGARMDWTGNQQGSGDSASCEFSHQAFEGEGFDRKEVTHKAWASCSEWR